MKFRYCLFAPVVSLMLQLPCLAYFADVQWGMDRENIPASYPVYRLDAAVSVRDKDISCEVEINKVWFFLIYGFDSNEGLNRITIGSEKTLIADPDIKDILFNYVVEMYGQPQQEGKNNNGQTLYIWESSASKVTLVFSSNKTSRVVVFIEPK